MNDSVTRQVVIEPALNDSVNDSVAQGSETTIRGKYNNRVGLMNETWSGGGGLGYGTHLGLVDGHGSQAPGTAALKISASMAPNGIHPVMHASGALVLSSPSSSSSSVSSSSTSRPRSASCLPREIMPRNVEPTDLDHRAQELLSLLRM